MQEKVDSLRKEFASDISTARTLSDIEALDVKYLGRKGPVQDLMKVLKDVSPEDRPRMGKVINDLKVELTDVLSGKQRELLEQEETVRLKSEKLDITLPGRKNFLGKKHIISKILDDILTIMTEMGFSVQYSPEIDTDFYNFESLNFAPDHPARDMQDTFYIAKEVLLRTHTTNIQVRFMENHKPPIRIVCPGKVYRNESINARSHVQFHQVDPLYIDKNVSFADLISTIEDFIYRLFGREIETRFRPSYFPFVEPGMEVDIRCLVCRGEGCPLCKQTGWLEILGAGMVHPEVLKSGGIDPEQYSGFAWGMGIERMALLKYGINDIRLFTENDLRFLRQF